jgi:hypothetical protein
MSFLWFLPWSQCGGSICLGRVNLAYYTRTLVKIPKFLRAASKLYRYMHSKQIMEKHVVKLRATLDVPRSRDQWIQAILLVESFKLVPTPFDEGFKTKKWQIEANVAPVLEGKSIGWDQNTALKGELVIWRTKNQARDPGTHTPTQGFNLLHMSPCIHLLEWALPFRNNNSKTHQRNVKFEFRHPDLV